MMQKKLEFFKNTAILGLGVFFSKAATFILLPFYTIYLSPSEFGLLDLLLTYIAYVAPFVILQLDWSIFRLLVDARDDPREIKRILSTGIHLIMSVAGGTLVLLLLTNLVIDIPKLSSITLLILSSISMTVLLQIARGLGKNKNYAIANMVNGLTTVAMFFVLVAWMNLGINGALLSLAIANTISSLYLFITLKIHKYLGFSSVDKTLRKKMIAYSLPLVPEGASWLIVNASDRIIITLFIGVAANGIYAVASKYALIMTVVFGIFHLSWSQAVSTHINDKDSFISDISNIALRLFGSLGLILIALLPLVFSKLIDSNFQEAYMYIPILITANFFLAIAGVYSGVYIAKNQTRQIAKTTLIAAAINIIVSLALINYIGIYAVALSSLMAYVFLALYRHYDIRKYVNVAYDSTILLSLIVLYPLIIASYYFNDMTLNYVSLIITVIFMFVINKNTLLAIKSKLLNKYTKDKGLYEETL